MAGGVFSTAQLFGMTIRESATDGSDFTNPAADYRRLFLGEDGALHTRDSSGNITQTHIPMGTAFPTGVTDEMFYRTDTNKVYFYDGTRWLTVNEYEIGFITRTVPNGISATNTLSNMPTRGSAGDMYLTRWEWVAFVATTNDGSNYWTLTLDKLTAGNSATNVATLSTQSNTPDNWVEESADINAVVVGSAHTAFRVIATKVSSGGNLTCGLRIKYREVAT